MQGAVLGTEELGTKWVYLLQGGWGVPKHRKRMGRSCPGQQPEAINQDRGDELLQPGGRNPHRHVQWVGGKSSFLQDGRTVHPLGSE